LSSGNKEIIKVFVEAFTKDKSRLKKWAAVAQKYIDLYGKKRFERHWTAEDILKEVITRVLEEKRNYNPEAYKDVDDFIYKTIQSIVWDEFRNRNKVTSSEKYIENDDGGEFVNIYENKHRTENDTIEKDFEIKEQLTTSYNQLLEDEDAALVFLCWKQGSTSQDIADELGIKLSNVESAKKRIRYKLTNGSKT
jgi:RNA polymerase sigma factor (sigma-70 family)